jgi:hypothetical protein
MYHAIPKASVAQAGESPLTALTTFRKKFTNTSKEDITKCVKEAGENDTDGKIARKMLQKIMK